MLSLNANRFLVETLTHRSSDAGLMNADLIAHLAGAAPRPGWFARWRAARAAAAEARALDRRFASLPADVKADLGLDGLTRDLPPPPPARSAGIGARGWIVAPTGRAIRLG